jgi:hypothetical protein
MFKEFLRCWSDTKGFVVQIMTTSMANRSSAFTTINYTKKFKQMKNQTFTLLLKPNPTRVTLLHQLMLLLLHQLADLVQAIFLDSLGLKICPLNILQTKQ